jgi:hypothetical protein
MMENLDLHLQNQSLKSAFAMRGLDLLQVWQPAPDDLELENRQAELEKLYACMEGANFSVDLVEGLPARFVYTIVREILE